MDQDLKRNLSMEIEFAENGLRETNTLVETDNANNDENKTFRAFRLTMLMILLNVCLFACPFLLYLYFNTMNAENRHQVLDFVIVIGGILAIMLLCRLGDLSKGRPNFYYI